MVLKNNLFTLNARVVEILVRKRSRDFYEFYRILVLNILNFYVLMCQMHCKFLYTEIKMFIKDNFLTRQISFLTLTKIFNIFCYYWTWLLCVPVSVCVVCACVCMSVCPCVCFFVITVKHSEPEEWNLISGNEFAYVC